MIQQVFARSADTALLLAVPHMDCMHDSARQTTFKSGWYDWCHYRCIAARTLGSMSNSHHVLVFDLQELAWCTYSLVCNVNCSCVLIVDGDDAVVGVRGFFGQSSLLSQQPEDNLQLLTKVHNPPVCELSPQQAWHHPGERINWNVRIQPS